MVKAKWLEGKMKKSLVCTKANLSLDRDQDKEFMFGMTIKILKIAWESMMVNGNLINLMEKEHYHFLMRKK